MDLIARVAKHFEDSAQTKLNAVEMMAAPIAAAIETGAKAYLKRQYQTVAFLAVAIMAVLLIFLGLPTAIGFLVGAVLSASAGIIGMLLAVPVVSALMVFMGDLKELREQNG